MSVLLPGTEVTARGLRWEIVSHQPVGEQQLYRLRCLEGGIRGEEVDLPVPFECLRPVRKRMDPLRASGLQHWRLYHQAFLLEQSLGHKAMVAIQPGRLRTAPYQIVPVMRALSMGRPRLMLADGVGLGKTIQAGLVITEMIARRRAHRILVVSPAGPLLDQWHTEMRERFGLRFAILDRVRLEEIRQANELGSNPFDYEARALISIDFAKQERILQDLERTEYDIVVIDEAHHCASLGTIGDREDSLRRRLAEVLARQSDCLLLLTATPHDGYDPHFASLVEILDTSLVDGKGALRGDAYKRHIVRRLKRHIKDPDTGAPMFKERQVKPCKVSFAKSSHRHFGAFQVELLSLIAPLLRRAKRQRRYNDVLAFISLLKRSVSTANACRKTLETITDRLNLLAKEGGEEQEARRQRLRTLRDYRRRLERFGTLSCEEEQDQAALEAEDMAAEFSAQEEEEVEDEVFETKRELDRERKRMKRLDRTRESLLKLVTLAEKAEKEDPKLSCLSQEIRAIRSKEPSANVLVYTEFTDSQDAVMAHLKEVLGKRQLSGEILQLSGRDDDATRTKLTARFREKTGLILVSTDATAEGLNLHTRCHHLIHLELPYNPNRLEQRNGRIDRFGQEEDPIVRYLYLTRTFEENILLRLIAKYERQRARLTFVPNTLGVISRGENSVETRLLDGIAEEGGAIFETPERNIEFGAENDDDLATPAYRELLEEVERAFSGFEKAGQSQSWLGESGLNADEKQIRAASEAQEQGKRLGIEDLLGFVCEAVQSDSADPNAVHRTSEGIWELCLSGAWTYDLEDIPGYDSSARILRLTTDLEITHDSQDRSVGFLGRAHPIVRRALDRVRVLQFGAGDGILDRRVSVARGDTSAPCLLYTFLGSIRSGNGPEFERVVAARVSQDGHTEMLLEFSSWQHLADAGRALPTKNAWESNFAPWADTHEEKARSAADEAFQSIAESFVQDHIASVKVEQEELGRWLEARAEEICGALQTTVQLDLLEQVAADKPHWQTLKDSKGRLAAYATDSSNPPRSRSEANGVLELHKRRNADLERRAALEKPRVEPLGMLMLLPAEGRDAS